MLVNASNVTREETNLQAKKKFLTEPKLHVKQGIYWVILAAIDRNEHDEVLEALLNPSQKECSWRCSTWQIKTIIYTSCPNESLAQL